MLCSHDVLLVYYDVKVAKHAEPQIAVYAHCECCPFVRQRRNIMGGKKRQELEEFSGQERIMKTIGKKKALESLLCVLRHSVRTHRLHAPVYERRDFLRLRLLQQYWPVQAATKQAARLHRTTARALTA